MARNPFPRWSLSRPPAAHRAFRVLMALAILAGAALSCSVPKTPTPTPPPTGGGGLTYDRSSGAIALAGGAQGMRLALSQGTEIPAQPERVPPAETQPLSPEQRRAVLGRLPALEGAPEDVQEFKLPPQTLPAPRPGQTIQQPFPPQEAGPPVVQPPAGPLKVLRYSPEGDVALAPYLSVTFDQAMVPLTALADLAALDVPVRLTPVPEGAWRWVGTKTLMFEPTVRFPMATRYSVQIPAGTASATGGKLAQSVEWTFTTPPPTIVSQYPTSGPHVRNPLLFIAFDQRIGPAAVLRTVRLSAGGRTLEVTMATAAEVEADETVARMAKSAGVGRWLAFRAAELLPYDTTVTVDVGPGAPSAEGPLTTAKVQSFQFYTFGPLRVVESQCGWGDICRPLMPWFIRFSNPLDEQAFEESLVQIAPELPGGKLSISDSTLAIEGRSQGRTTYKVTLKAGIKDVFGQTLGEDTTASFTVGSAEPTLYTPGEAFVVVDPASKPVYSVFSINYPTLHVRAYAVKPTDWADYVHYLQENQRVGEAEPPGRKVLDKQLGIEGAADALTETPIDLTPFLPAPGRTGHVILVVEPPELAGTPSRDRGWRPVVRVWVQVTRIGLDAFVDGQHMTAWANALSDGSSLADVELTLYPGGSTARSGADGLARLTLPTATENEFAYLTGRKGDDTAILPENAYWWGGNWTYRTRNDECRWYVIDDRQMYRPGEEVHVKGWVRVVSLSEGVDVFKRPGLGASISYSLQDAQGNQLLNGTARVNALGGFDTAFKLPETMNLGNALLQISLYGVSADGTSHSHSLQVQEFRRPEFEVSATVSPGPHFADGFATATVAATYYAGGPLPNADVNWLVTSQPGTFHPPNWDDFTFGIWVPWWRFYAPWEIGAGGNARSESFQGTTDAAGTHNLRIDFHTVEPPQPTSVTAEATVMDVNRQAWSSSAQILVHPADLYVGLRTERTFVERGKIIQVDAIVTDLDGNPVTDRPIEVRAVRLDWQWNKGTWSEVEVDEQRCTVGSAQKPVSCEFQTPEGGTYRITATIVDAKGRRNLSQITVWVSGGQRPTANKLEKEVAVLIPDRKEYQPGDTAEMLVQAPFVPAEGLLTVRRAGLLRTERFRMTEPTYTLRVPILEAHIPNVYVQVDLVGAAARLNSDGKPDSSLPARPAFASGAMNLSVPPYSRTLAVQVAPDVQELEPGGETTVRVQVKDAAGRPVAGAEVAVIVVDEAVLALTGYQLADPLAAFYPQRDSGVADYYLREHILLVNPEQLARDSAQVLEMRAGAMPTMSPAPAGKGAMDEALGQAGQPIRVRTNFDPLATFAPELPTGADGRATVKVTVPDSLTRYRIMAVAVAGDRQFGKAEATLTARLPLMVRPSPPRFLNFGDRFELPVVIQNGTDQPMQVDVAVRASVVQLVGSAAVVEPSGLSSAAVRVTVPAKDRREVRFPCVTLSAGTARFQVGATAGQWADAAEFSLPVYTPATTEAFAVYGTLDSGAVAQPVVAPTDAYTQFGGLEISTSSTALQALSDAVLYLVSYPYECSEQLASRILAIAALRDVLSAFHAESLPPPAELNRVVQRDIELLQGMQDSDGGFPVWRRGQETWPFHTIHIAHALARARQKGYSVPEEMVSKALFYLRNVENKWPSWYSEECRNTLTAYALFVRAQLGDLDVARARRLIQEKKATGLQPEAVGWLLSVLTGDAGSTREVAEIRRYLDNRTVETAGGAHFATSYREEDGYLLLASDRRADGVILEALIRDQPQSDLIPKLVKGLLAQQKRGHWNNTQENVFILLALDKYFQAYEAQTPDFVARAWLGEGYVAEFQFRGRSPDYKTVNVPMSYLAQQPASQNLVLSKEGTGRLYYRLGIQYAPTSLKLDPLDAGFTVLRAYEAVDDPADVRQDEDGVWHIRAGARVRVRLTMVAPSRRYHVALTDPLPAGLEAQNPALAVTGSIPQDPAEAQRSPYWWWHWTWYEHQNLRDQRAEAFASLLWDGIHTYTYVARATTPGDFVVPPAKAEEMYSPEVFGRGGTDRVLVEDVR